MNDQDIKSFEALELAEQNRVLAESCLSFKTKTKEKRLFTAGEVNERDTKFGIFNPAVCPRENGELDLIMRCEPSQATWGGHLLHQKAVPYLGKVKVNGDGVGVSQPTKLSGGTTRCQRHEDWRLFRGLDGELYSNFTNYYYFNRGFPQKVPTARTCISRIKGEKMEFLDELNATRHLSMNREEKNWLIFSHEGRYFCLYRCEPFTLFEMTDDFEVRGIARLLKFPLKRLLGTFMANGSNPVFHENKKFGRHYITICHNFSHSPESNKRNRTYFHYALIISHDSLRPIGFSSRPIFGGALKPRSGRHNNISYVSGFHLADSKAYLFYGEGDTHSNCCVMEQGELYDWIDPL